MHIHKPALPEAFAVHIAWDAEAPCGPATLLIGACMHKGVGVWSCMLSACLLPSQQGVA